MATIYTYALTTVADVKETLGIESGDSSQNNLIIRKINQATDMIESWCGFDNDHHLAQTTYTSEEYDGTGTTELFLKAKPVTSVTSFQVRSTIENENDWDDISTSDYFVNEHEGIIEVLFHLTESYNLFRVTYVSGFSTIPSDLAEACVTLAAYLVDNASTGSGVKRKQEGRREIEYFQPAQGDSLITQLGLDDTLTRYMMPSLAGW